MANPARLTRLSHSPSRASNQPQVRIATRPAGAVWIEGRRARALAAARAAAAMQVTANPLLRHVPGDYSRYAHLELVDRGQVHCPVLRARRPDQPVSSVQSRRYREDLIRIMAAHDVRTKVCACSGTTWASEDKVLECPGRRSCRSEWKRDQRCV